MIRLALPKGRNLSIVLPDLRAAGVALDPAADPRRLRWTVPFQPADLPEPIAEVEVLLLKDADVPLYVEQGVAEIGIVGSDVLDENGADLLVPVRWRDGRSRLSFIGRPRALPRPGTQVRLATKYPRVAAAEVARRSWGAEIVTLSGSVELAPLLGLAEVALDVVQTGRTLADNGLVELERVREVAPCLVAGRAGWQRFREPILQLVRRLEAAEVVT